jgi:hypothetical protein
MKKRNVKKLKLKGEVKLLLFGFVATVAFVLLYSARVEGIQNNANGYTESGHAHAVEVNFTR